MCIFQRDFCPPDRSALSGCSSPSISHDIIFFQPSLSIFSYIFTFAETQSSGLAVWDGWAEGLERLRNHRIKVGTDSYDHHVQPPTHPILPPTHVPQCLNVFILIAFWYGMEGFMSQHIETWSFINSILVSTKKKLCLELNNRSSALEFKWTEIIRLFFSVASVYLPKCFIVFSYRYFLSNIRFKRTDDIFQVWSVFERSPKTSNCCVWGTFFWIHRAFCTDVLPTASKSVIQ